MRRSQYRPGAEHRMSDCDERPAQVYAQAMAAARAQRFGGLAAFVAGLTQMRRRNP
jgi:hypothetical protein